MNHILFLLCFPVGWGLASVSGHLALVWAIVVLVGYFSSMK